jgi:hypothetical protein
MKHIEDAKAEERRRLERLKEQDEE